MSNQTAGLPDLGAHDRCLRALEGAWGRCDLRELGPHRCSCHRTAWPNRFVVQSDRSGSCASAMPARAVRRC